MASLGHPCKFQRLSRLGSVTARHSSSGCQPNFAALNRGRHLYSPGRPSRWALAHVSSFIGNFFVGVLAYTDNITLLVPSAAAMHRMLQIGCNYVVEFSIKFNTKKTKCVEFMLHGVPRKFRPSLMLDGQIIDYVVVVVVVNCIYKPCVFSHSVASAIAAASSSLDCGQLLTICDIV